MSDKVRIYQLARDLGVENRDLLAVLDEIGVEYKSHSSTLDAETAETVRQLVAAAPAGSPAGAAAAAPAPATPGDKMSAEEKAARLAKGGKPAAAP